MHGSIRLVATATAMFVSSSGLALMAPLVQGGSVRFSRAVKMFHGSPSTRALSTAAARRARRLRLLASDEIAGSVKLYDRHIFVLDPVRGHERWPTHMEDSGFYMVSEYLKAMEAAAGQGRFKLKLTVAEAGEALPAPDAAAYPAKHSVLIFPVALAVHGVDKTSVAPLVRLLLTEEDDRLAQASADALPSARVCALEPGLDVFVCCHKVRDRRCAEWGPRLVGWLREEAGARGVMARVWPCSHIGGHRYAGNAITFPGGDWWGQVNSQEDARRVLEEPRPLTLPSAGARHLWRGRVGLDEAQQEEVYNRAKAN